MNVSERMSGERRLASDVWRAVGRRVISTYINVLRIRLCECYGRKMK